MDNESLKLYRVLPQAVETYEIPAGELERYATRPLSPAGLRTLIDDLLQHLPDSELQQFKFAIRDQGMI